MPADSRPPIAKAIPPLFLGTAAFNSQYNTDPFTLPVGDIVRSFLDFPTTSTISSTTHTASTTHTSSLANITPAANTDGTNGTGINGPFVGFDTSPYYGPAELLLGRALNALQAPHLVYLHDVEFVTREEILSAIATLRMLRDEGKIRYIGISAFPVTVLCQVAEYILEQTGEPLDAVLSYANYTVQNTRLQTEALSRLTGAGVQVIVNGSLLGMGLLRKNGVPVGAMGDFHPSGKQLRRKCADAAAMVEARGYKLEDVAYRWALESWAAVGAVVGSHSNPTSHPESQVKPASEDDGTDMDTTTAGDTSIPTNDTNIDTGTGVSVIGVSYLSELQAISRLYTDILAARNHNPDALARRTENEALSTDIQTLLGDSYNEVWDSPGLGFKRGEMMDAYWRSDEELWPQLIEEKS
ncbi:hypothetical protein ABW21_db0207572 [Orbilia brochopaga]|nr:hypothetical protein ABW21_db0207572 [Drechslerella brochopaga]